MNPIIIILVMALVTYLIRMLPLTAIRRDITSTYVRSFLHYVPFVTLAVMTFPAILSDTSSVWSGLAAFVAALIVSYLEKGLILTSLSACAAVLLVEWLL